MASPQNKEKQSAVVHFDGYAFPVCISPPGDEYNAVSAAANRATRQGKGNIATNMVNHRNECYIEWKTVKPTGIKKEKVVAAKPQRRKKAVPVFGRPVPTAKRQHREVQPSLTLIDAIKLPAA